MAHAQKPDFVFRRNGQINLNWRGASVQSTTGSRVVRISGSNAGYTMFRGSKKGTGYPLHSPVSPSLPLPCITVCPHVSTGLYISPNGGLRGSSIKFAWQMQQNTRTFTPVCGQQNGVRGGTLVCATSQKVAGSTPDGIIAALWPSGRLSL